MIPDNVKKTFELCTIVYFATASKEGNPNCVPIYCKKIMDDKVLLLDNYMNESLDNLLENEKVCVSFYNPYPKESYKLKGEAEYHTKGDVFDQGCAIMPSKSPKGVVLIKINGVYSLKAGSDSKKNLF